jgi:outer membrane protein OmpA-like peptidoglycan-associated protein
MNKSILAAMIVAASVTVPNVFAQESADVVQVSRDIKPAAIEEGLFPESICEAAKRKGIKCGGLPQPRIYELPPTFTFSRGTAVLSDEGKSVLGRFGDVMRARQGPDIRFKITGHTDITGTEEINKKLSLERAAAVKTFFVKEYGINSDAIQIEGLAAMKLKRPDDPSNAANRRVDIARVMSK